MDPDDRVTISKQTLHGIVRLRLIYLAYRALISNDNRDWLPHPSGLGSHMIQEEPGRAVPTDF